MVDTVIWCYRLLLGREPEDLSVVSDWLNTCSDLNELVLRFLHSPEFKKKHTIFDYDSSFDQHIVLESLLNFKDVMGHKIVVNEEYFINSFGLKTYYENIPFKITRENIDLSLMTIPYPSDGWMADAIEYFSILNSIVRANSEITFIELGAGWGPWASLVGCICRSINSKANLCCVEGSEKRIALLKRHLVSNNLLDTTKVIEGVVNSSNGEVIFSEKGIDDMGAHIISEGETVACTTCKVNSFMLKDIMSDYKIVDMIHFDIQGSEYDVIESSLFQLNDQVRSIMIGTHSRIIEGKCIDLLSSNNWKLVCEQPAKIKYDHITYKGTVMKDGAQYWLNCNKI